MLMMDDQLRWCCYRQYHSGEWTRRGYMQKWMPCNDMWKLNGISDDLDALTRLAYVHIATERHCDMDSDTTCHSPVSHMNKLHTNDVYYITYHFEE